LPTCADRRCHIIFIYFTSCNVSFKFFEGAQEDIWTEEDEVTREWRKLYNKELHDLYSLLSIIRIIKSGRMLWAGHVARIGEKRNTYRLLVGKSEGKRPLGRPRRMWVHNIRMDLGEVGWDDVDWNGLTQDRNRWRALVNSALNLRVP
jgi:hypothetical protein